MLLSMENPPDRIRKQVYFLTVQDLLDYTIWEFCPEEEGIKGQDEATVKPSVETEVPGFSPGAYVVAADVRYGDGTSALGYLYSGHPEDLGGVQPNLVLATGQVNFWIGHLRFLPRWESYLADKKKLLHLSSDLLFPLSFETRASINGAPLKVVLEGFMACNLDDQIIRLP
jgi:hypothetical protein